MLTKSLLAGLALFVVAGVGNATEGIMMSRDQLDWKEVTPGSPAIKRVILWGDRDKGEYGMLLKVAPGTVAPVHAHTGDYHALCIKGIWRHSFDGGEQRDLPSGSYLLQPGMGMHGDACVGPEECIFFIHQYVKGDYIPKP
jgi:quercetin dioxygenase-like cupin family protein